MVMEQGTHCNNNEMSNVCLNRVGWNFFGYSNILMSWTNVRKFVTPEEASNVFQNIFLIQIRDKLRLKNMYSGLNINLVHLGTDNAGVVISDVPETPCVIVLISYVKNYSLILARNFSFNSYSFTCEIAKLPWQPSVRLSVKMATKF